MLEQIACEAVRKRVCLTVTYDLFTRLVEVHTVGLNAKGHHIASVWQTSGGSKSNELSGWKLLILCEATGATLTNINSLAPRPGYKPNASQFTRIIYQV